MKYVLDACVGIKWLLAESDSAKALVLRDDFVNRVLQLLTPDTFPPEVAHALTRAERRGILTPTEGALRFTSLLTALPTIHTSLPLLPRAYELSSQMKIGVFDCLYVALAEAEQCQVVSTDQRMITLFPGQVISLDSL